MVTLLMLIALYALGFITCYLWMKGRGRDPKYIHTPFRFGRPYGDRDLPKWPGATVVGTCGALRFKPWDEATVRALNRSTNYHMQTDSQEGKSPTEGDTER